MVTTALPISRAAAAGFTTCSTNIARSTASGQLATKPLLKAGAPPTPTKPRAVASAVIVLRRIKDQVPFRFCNHGMGKPRLRSALHHDAIAAFRPEG